MNLRLPLFSLLVLPLLQAKEVSLRIESPEGNHERVKIDGGQSVTIAEGGPIELRLLPTSAIDPRATVLQFEVFSLGGCKNVSANLSLPSGLKRQRALPEIGHSEAWTTYTATLVPKNEPSPYWKSLTLNLPLAPTATLNIRKARLVTPGTGKPPSNNEAAVELRDQLLQKYLEANSDARIDQVVIGSSEITVTLTTGAETQGLFLGELPIFRSIDDPKRFEFMAPLGVGPNTTSSHTFPRIRDRLGREYDRLTSRWQLVRVIDGERLPVSHARYADEFPSAHPGLPAVESKTKKGLGGWSAARQPKGDLGKLGISAVTVNVLLDGFLARAPGPHTTPFKWQGRTYHANNKQLEKFDATFLEAAHHDNLVSVVLLIANPNRNQARPRPRGKDSQVIGHPEADPSGVFAMPAMDSESSVGAYGAALHLLASRYSRPDGKFGRIHHYIVHNEVDAGWTWTNCGEKPLTYFFDLYHRSMRLVDLITRSQDPNARPFITLTHHWAKPGNPKFYGSKHMLVELAKWTRAEGDFPWALAHHPYPASLRKPRTWEDKVTFSFDSDRITPRNIEVLDAWMRRPDMLDKHGKTRPVHLSENGFNSPDYSKKSLTDQAAGMAYAWKKIAPLDTITVWHYHNWIDNRHEGGLRIGLRKFPDDAKEPLGEKPIFKLYRDLATGKEDAACAPYLPVVGFTSWAEAIHSGPIR